MTLCFYFLLFFEANISIIIQNKIKKKQNNSGQKNIIRKIKQQTGLSSWFQQQTGVKNTEDTQSRSSLVSLSSADRWSAPEHGWSLCGLEWEAVSFLVAAGQAEYFLTMNSPWVWAEEWDRAGSGKKDLAAMDLPTSEVWLREEETRWPQDSEQGNRCPTALPWGTRPRGSFMFWRPSSRSVNTMCFLFHAGVETVIVRHFFCFGPNASRALALGRVLSLHVTQTLFGALGLTSQVGRAPDPRPRFGA